MNKKKRKQKRLAKKMSKQQPKGLLSCLESNFLGTKGFISLSDSRVARLQKQVDELSREIGKLKKGE